MQSVETAGPDGVREQGPILFIRLWRLWHSVGCPCSRSDRSAITSHRARNLVKLISSLQLSCVSSFKR